MDRQTRHPNLAIALVGALLAAGLATPAIARERLGTPDPGQHQRHEQDKHDKRGKHKRDANAHKAHKATVRAVSTPPRATPRPHERRAAQPSPRALAVRQREQAHARTAIRRDERQRAANDARRRAALHRVEHRHQDDARKHALRQRDLASLRMEAARRAAEARRHQADRHDGDHRRDDHRGTMDRDEHRHRIAEQRHRAEDYRRYADARRALEHRRAEQIRRQRRMAQYRYQQAYYRQLMAQQARLNALRYDYRSNPYFNAPASYRYVYGGNAYTTNRYGADMLRQAVNYGYQQGLRAGRADRHDGWRSDYRDNYAYQDASYGYDNYYVSRNDYNYYFRQGFQRGYQDGYYGRSQYGRYGNNEASILQAVLSMILNLQQF